MSRVGFQLLGTGNAFLPQGRLHSLLLIDDKILVDCPPTVIASLRQAEIPLSDISTILFTHWHGDHCFGFPFFLLERKYISDRAGESKLWIYNPKGGKKKLSHLCDLAYPDSLIDSIEDRCSFLESDSGTILGVNGWTYERFKVLHDECVDPHGYVLCHESGFTIMHTGDSGPCESIESRVGNCDVVVIEMGVPDSVETENHFSPKRLTTLATKFPNTIFIVTHTYIDDPNSGKSPIITAELPHLPSNCTHASDNMKWEWENGKIEMV